jgi:hypothetical protein
MARATATFTVTEATNWLSGSFFRWDLFLAQVLQNIEFFAQTHDHSGDPGDGASSVAGDAKAIWYYGAASPTWG